MVRRCFEAWDRRDVDGVVESYHEDVVFDATDITDGVYRGRSAVRKHFLEIFDAMPLHHTDLRFEESGDRVAVATRIVGEGARSGASAPAGLGYVFTLHDGAVMHVRIYRDPDDALKEVS